MFSDLAAVEAYLNSLINYEFLMPLGGRDWPKLEPTREAIVRLGLPFSIPSCLHIAGTKGKGSVAAFLEALLAPDHSTLSFTSPHLISFTERVRLNGKPLEDRVWYQGFTEIVPRLQGPPVIKLTYFESTFIFYLWAARHLGSEAHIVEAGLGGRWDATNALQNTVSVLTLVDYDHTEILGKTLTEIAGDKSGIIKPHSRVVIARQPSEALAVYERVAAENSAQTFVFGRDFGWDGGENDAFHYHELSVIIPDITLNTRGRHQRDNAATAIRAARLIDPELSASQVRERLAECIVLGRQQLLAGHPDVLLDVAHNPASFEALADTLRREFGDRRIAAVTGLMKDKDARECFRHLQGLLSQVWVVSVDSPRAYPADELAALLKELGFAATAMHNREEAFAALHEPGDHDLGLVTGSFYLAGDYLTWRQRAGIA